MGQEVFVSNNMRNKQDHSESLVHCLHFRFDQIQKLQKILVVVLSLPASLVVQKKVLLEDGKS